VAEIEVLMTEMKADKQEIKTLKQEVNVLTTNAADIPADATVSRAGVFRVH
jgi:hypothetical protein